MPLNRPTRRELALAVCAAFTSPTTYALLFALLVTVGAKLHAAVELAAGSGVVAEALGACAWDLVIYPALALLFDAGERVRPWVRWVTRPLALLAVGVSLVNAAYVMIANDQIDAHALSVGFNRFQEVADIAVLEATRRAGRHTIWVALLLPFGFVGLRRLWAKVAGPERDVERYRARALAALLALGVVALGGARMAGRPKTLGVALIADNTLVHTYATWLESSLAGVEPYQHALERHFGLPLAQDGAVEALARDASRPDVLLVVLESTRYDHVELPLASRSPWARTPTIRALAERGAFFTDVQVAMPHTSKSLFTMLCGRLPAMENAILEPADGVARGCLPELLRRAGYATAFFQTAIGSFEDRPRLVTSLGYERFEAFETVGAAPLGYLAGDDRALSGAFEAWLGALRPEQRLFATLLTSGTHHPYALPDGVSTGRRSSARARYRALVALEDQVVGEVLDALRRAGRLERTLVVVLADHGEGLPGDPVHQHDNDFFEHGLHVPLVLAGPGVPRGRRDGLTSLLDVAPTVLGRLGVSTALPRDERRFGRDAFGGPERTVAPFACWSDDVCEGYVDARAKVVRLPSDDRSLAFDRGGDERSPRPPTGDEEERLDAIHEVFVSTRLDGAPLAVRRLTLPSGFVCGEPGSCVHPSRPEGGFHRRH
jgi:glucan phosphoethanolaminetransferase (alkaline phosphatase superfamily)